MQSKRTHTRTGADLKMGQIWFNSDPVLKHVNEYSVLDQYTPTYLSLEQKVEHFFLFLFFLSGSDWRLWRGEE